MINFLSEHYQYCSFRDLLLACYKPNLNHVPICLSNQNKIIIPSLLLQDKINLISLNKTILIDIKEFIVVQNSFLSDCGMVIAEVNLLDKFATEISLELYLQTCYSILSRLLSYVETIFNYTYDHLNNRSCNTTRLVQIDSIQLTLAKIMSLVESTRELLLKHNERHFFYLASKYLINALHELAKLGGGRAMLRGNAIELLFYTKLFQTTYLKDN